MKFIPRPYQLPMIDFLHEHPRSALWVPMGLGKTSATLTALNELDMIGETNPVLVLAPLRVCKEVWPAEIRKWDHLRGMRSSLVIGNVKQRRQALAKDAKIYITNYEQIPWLVEEMGKHWRFKTIVADESTRLKSFRGGFRRHYKSGKIFYAAAGGARARALGRLAHIRTDRFIELTGTPAPNGLKDLWAQLWFLDAGKRLGASYGAFKTRWFHQGYNGVLEPNATADHEIHNRVRNIAMALRAKDWFDVKDLIKIQVTVELPPGARKTYEEMQTELFTEIEKEGIEAANAAVMSTKCLQIASGALWMDRATDRWAPLHDAKIAALESLHEELQGAPLLVVYHWRHTKDRLLQAFPKAVAFADAPNAVKDWNAGEIDMLLVHPQNAGHGLNLQYGGHHVVFVDHWWASEEHDQVIERLGPVRQIQSGFDRPVYVYYLIAEDTLDETVMERLETKRSVQDLLLAAARRKRCR